MVSGGNTADLCSPTESSRKAGTWDVWASGKEGPSKKKKEKRKGLTVGREGPGGEVSTSPYSPQAAYWGVKPLTSPSSVPPMGRAIPHGASGRNRPGKDKGTLMVVL